MPIDRLVREGKVEPKDVARLDRAFAITLKSLP